MKKIQHIFLYIRHFSFIAFLIAITLLYPAFNKFELGHIYLTIFIFYILISFIMFFIKNEDEEKNILNNFVIIILNIYICLIAYKYNISSNYAIDNNYNYFSFNLKMVTFCLLIISINKLIIVNPKINFTL